jgi:hypothetical protein
MVFWLTCNTKNDASDYLFVLFEKRSCYDITNDID